MAFEALYQQSSCIKDYHADENHEGTRTLNLLIRSQTPYPLGHVVPCFRTNHKQFEIACFQLREEHSLIRHL